MKPEPATLLSVETKSSGMNSGYVHGFVTSKIDRKYNKAIQRARDTWNTVIKGSPIKATTFSQPYTLECSIIYELPENVLIDGIGIVVTTTTFGWSNDIYVRSEPCEYQGNLPFLGAVMFDVWDIESIHEQGKLYEVVLHEFGHVLGLGTLWSHHNLLGGANQYGGYYGNVGYLELYQSSQEKKGGAEPTLYAPLSHDQLHWDEKSFGGELLTPTINTGSGILSVMTVYSLMDFGYDVNTELAESYHLPSLEKQALKISPTVSTELFDLSNDTVDARVTDFFENFDNANNDSIMTADMNRIIFIVGCVAFGLAILGYSVIMAAKLRNKRRVLPVNDTAATSEDQVANAGDHVSLKISL